MKKKKLRLSYSLLSAWAKGRPDEAVNIYFHLDMMTNKAMKDGRRIHKQIADFVLKERQFPDWLSTITLKNPVPEKKVIVKYNELFDLSAVFDCLDTPTLHELKTGVTDSLVWSRQMQIPFYFLVAEIADIEVDKCYLTRWNQHEKQSDYTLVWNSKRLKDEARNFIDTLGPDIYDFFKMEGLI